jgi:uncharacterized protein YciI
MDMSTYYACLLLKGPAWTAAETPELERLQERHLAHLTELRASGKLLVAGPCIDGGNLRGISIFKTASLEEARILAQADPAVQAGRFVVELHTWMAPGGALLP